MLILTVLLVSTNVFAGGTTPTFTITGNPASPVCENSIITFNVVSSNSPFATGKIHLYDGAIEIKAADLDINGTATLSTASLAAGSHTLSITYSGDASYDSIPPGNYDYPNDRSP